MMCILTESGDVLTTRYDDDSPGISIDFGSVSSNRIKVYSLTRKYSARLQLERNTWTHVALTFSHQRQYMKVSVSQSQHAVW